MKKTTTINLAGMVFHIEEDGYFLLKEYFDDLRRVFSKQEGMDEMILDIESRFAELFQERLHEHKEVVTQADVSEVTSIMGSPSQYDDVEDNGGESSESEDHHESHSSRRLYRDTEEGIIGGVAAGTAHYFNMDPVIVRVLWIVFVLLGGSGGLVYLIAWIVIPEAKTTSQKLQMKGQFPNLDNMKAYMGQATDEVKKGFNRAKRKADVAVRNSRSASSSFAKAFLKIAGIFILFIGVTSLIGICVAFFLNYSQITINNALIDTSVNSITSLFFINQTISFWFLFVVALIPVLFIVLLGFKLILNQRLKIKVLSFTLLGIWIVAIIGLANVSIKSGLEFKEKYVLEEQVVFPADYDLLSLYFFEDNIEITDAMKYEFDNYVSIDDQVVWLGYAHVELIQTQDSVFYYTIEKSSKGGTLKSAKENTEKINFFIERTDSIIDIETRFNFPKSSKFRDQKVRLKVYVPVGKEVVLNGNLKYYPIKIKGGNMTSKGKLNQTSRWRATERGIEWVD